MDKIFKWGDRYIEWASKPSRSKTIILVVIFIITFLSISFTSFFSAPIDFPSGSIVNIPEGKGLHNVSLQLKNENIIRSRTAFEAFVIMYGGEKHIIPADYLFESEVPVWEVARRISKGERHLAPIKVTIPEGFNTKEMAEAFAVKLTNFNKERFLLEAQGREGYLFPDTYFFFTTDTEVEVLRSMSENYEKKVSPIRSQIISSGKTEKNIIIMASLVEGEAKGDTDRAIISGILWKRISIGMPLQADAAPETYKHKGLPANPIGNPGLEAIEAAIYPQTSPYLYYIHDKQGIIHFAKTLAEHNANVRKYLK